MFTNKILILMASASLAACASLPSADSRYTLESTQKIVSAQETQAFYNLQSQWWTAYNDATLNQLIEHALAENIDLKKAAITVNKALYQANILGANLVPSFSGSVNASHNRNLKTDASTRSYGSQLGLSYELDLWRKLSAQADAQVWEYQATQADMAAARLSLINSVANAYFQLAYLNEAKTLTQKSGQQYQEIARIVQAKHKHGKVASIESVNAQQSLQSARNSLLSLEQEYSNQVNTLSNLLNQPSEQVQTAAATYRLPKIIGVDLNVPISVLANRPDLRAAEYRLQSALQSQHAQARSWYPSITLGASLSTSSNQAKNAFDVPFLGGTVQVNLPFLNWQTLQWQDKTAQANFDSAKLDFEQALQTALNEVGKHYQQYRLSEQASKLQNQRLVLAEKNTRYYQVRYQHGKNELKDWLEALNQGYSQASTSLNARFAALQAEASVYQAMAGRYQSK